MLYSNESSIKVWWTIGSLDSIHRAAITSKNDQCQIIQYSLDPGDKGQNDKMSKAGNNYT